MTKGDIVLVPFPFTDLSGYIILFDDFLKVEVGLRALVGLSVCSGAGGVLLKWPLHHLLGAIGGAVAMLAAYLYARFSSDEADMQLRYGAFVALAGFAMTVITSVRQLRGTSVG